MLAKQTEASVGVQKIQIREDSGQEASQHRAEKQGRQAAYSTFQPGLFTPNHTESQTEAAPGAACFHKFISAAPSPFKLHVLSQMEACHTKFKPRSLVPHQVSAPNASVHVLGLLLEFNPPQIFTEHLLYARHHLRTGDTAKER